MPSNEGFYICESAWFINIEFRYNRRNAMDLAELKFVVNTKDLDEAAKKIDVLAASVSKVNAPVAKAAIDSEKLAKAQAEVAEKSAKATLAQLKLKEAQDRTNTTTSSSVSVLERQQMILEYMAQGLSKGQSSYVATAKAAGALDDELQQLITTLKTQRTLQGSEPFDKSIGLMQKLQNETRTTNEVNQLFNRNLGLTEKQMVDLAREKERLIALYGIEGRSLSGLEAEYEKIIQLSTQINHANDARTNGMRSQVKAQNDAAKASKYLEETDARLAAALDETNKHMDKAGSDAWVKYQRAVSTAGLSADEAAIKLANARKQFDALADKKQADKLQYLARAISVQMGDVGISLASGMNPLLVMIQQGDQIRGAIQQAGASGKELEKAMSGAAGQIATSFIQTGQAIGGFFVNAVGSATKALFAVPFSLMSAGMATLAGNATATTVALTNLKIAAIALSKVGIVALIAAIAFVTMSTIDAIKEYRELTTTLTMSGAAMGLTTQQALDQAKSMKELGASNSEAIKIISEMAKTGQFTAENIGMVTEAAVGLQKYGGIAIEDTVKKFAEIGKDPVKALIEYGKQTGFVNAEQIKHIKNLVDTDQKAKAVKEAMSIMGDGSKEAIQTMKDESGTLLNMWINILELMKDFKDFIAGIGRIKFGAEDITKTLIEIRRLEASKTKPWFNEAHQKELDKAYELLEKQKRLATSSIVRSEASAGVKKLEGTINNTPQHSGFTAPKDEALADTLLAYKNAEKLVTVTSSRLVATNKAAFALGLKDMDQYLSDELALISNENNEKLSLNEKYLRELDADEVKQKAALESAAGKRIAVASVKDRKDIQEQLKTEISKTSEQYDREREKITANSAVITENTAKLREQSVAQLGVYTKKVIEGAREFAKAEDEVAEKRKLQMDMEQATAGLYGANLAKVKATIETEQRHIKTISDLTIALERAKEVAARFGEANGPQSEDVTKAQAAVLAAELSLGAARVTAKKAVAKAGADAEASYLDESTKRLNAYGQAFENMFSGMADAIVEFAKTGKLNFGDLVNSMIADLIRFEMKKQSMSIYEGIGGAAGIFKAFGIATGGSTGSTLPPVPEGYDWGTMMPIKPFANGGTFTNSIVDSPTLFKFAKGTGLMGEAGPEAIMPLRRGADGSLGVAATGGSSGNVSVQVINNSNAQATTNETVDSKGNRKIEVVIGDMTAGEISRSGSASQKSIKSTFGLQPQLIRR